MSSLLRLKWNLSSSRFSNNTHPACSIPWYIHKNRIKTPDASGDKPSFADKPRSEWHATIYIMCYHRAATNVPPICTAVFILFIALWGKVSSDTWWWMSPMHVVNLVHVRASETSTIINSKHESLPTGCLYSVFFLTHLYTTPSAQSVKSVFTNPHPTLLSNNNKYIISMIFLVKCLKRVKHHVFGVKNV